MPELPLSLDLHLHHGVVSVLDVLQSFVNPGKQVNDLLFADQDFTVGVRQIRENINDVFHRHCDSLDRLSVDLTLGMDSSSGVIYAPKVSSSAGRE